MGLKLCLVKLRLKKTLEHEADCQEISDKEKANFYLAKAFVIRANKLGPLAYMKFGDRAQRYKRKFETAAETSIDYFRAAGEGMMFA